MESAARAALADEMELALRRHVAEAWFPRCLDIVHGGYLHCLDRDGKVIDTDKSVWAQVRMAWKRSWYHQDKQGNRFPQLWEPKSSSFGKN